MQSAAWAEQADAWLNPQFRRRWETPQKRERPGPNHQPRPPLNLQNTSTVKDNQAQAAAQRACRAAARRIADLELRAEVASAVGLIEAADRFLDLASTIRREVLR